MAPHAEEPAHRASFLKMDEPRKPIDVFKVMSPNVKYTEDEILSRYIYHTTTVKEVEDGSCAVQPQETVYNFKVQRKVGRVGIMLVGWGGNNGSTVTAGILANRLGLTWDTREGVRAANYYGSVTMSSTVKLGVSTATGKDVNIPFRDMLPMVDPNDLVIGGWDISSMNLAEAMDRAQVLEPSLKTQLKKMMTHMRPLPSIYYPDFIAANQSARANNLIPGSHASSSHVSQIREDIR